MKISSVAAVCALIGVTVLSSSTYGEEQGNMKLTCDPLKSVLYCPEDVWVKVAFVTQQAGGASIRNPTMWNGEAFLFFEVNRESEAGSVSSLSYAGGRRSGPSELVRIAKDKPLERMINLRYCYDLSLPGTYRIRAVYSDPLSKLRLVSDESTIEVREGDTRESLAKREVGSHNELELIRIKDRNRRVLLLVKILDNGRKRYTLRCVRIDLDSSDKPTERVSIREVERGEIYEAIVVALRKKKTLLIDVKVNGPEVLTTVVDEAPEKLELKTREDGKHALVDKTGKEYSGE